MNFDKFKWCKDCPDRTVLPNCHSTCEGYLNRCREAEEKRQKKLQEFNIDDYITKRKARIFKMTHHEGKKW